MVRCKPFSENVRRPGFPSYRPVVEVLEDRTVPSFIAPASYDVGVYASFVAVGDFNDDGIPDVAAVTNGQPGAVGIALGKGDGSFQTANYYYLGSDADFVAVRDCAVGDFNGDGHLDLAVTIEHNGYGAVSVLLGNGDGTLQPAQDYPVGQNPRSIAVGDFNGDGHLDLAVAAYTPGPDYQGMVSILLGNGDGTFQAAHSYLTGNGASSLAVGDFNGDGIPDLAVSGNGPAPDYQGTVSILLGNGDGTFKAPQSYAAGYGSVSVAVGDFNHDGVSDLAVGNFDGYVTVLLGEGDGSFGKAQLRYAVGSNASNPESVAVGDFNGDGTPDLVVASTDESVSVLLGLGNGTFQTAVRYDFGSNPASVVVGDFNGDGKLDFAVVGGLGVIIVLGKGDGTFKVAPTYSGFFGAGAVAVGDFNGDGILDLATGGSEGVNVLLGKGDGTFEAAQSYAVGAEFMAVGDFNGDGILDLAVMTQGGSESNPDGTLTILLGNGDGTFHVGQSYSLGAEARSLAVGDFNGDGTPDLAVTCDPGRLVPGWVSILLGNGDGTFKPAVNHAVGYDPVFLVVGDFNGDGYADLAVSNYGSYPVVSILLGDGYGSFRAAGSIPFLGSVNSLAVGDFNGDGILDLAVGNPYPTARVSIFLGNGDGSFQLGQSYAVGFGCVVGDFNRDGIVDLAMTGPGGVLTILLGNGDGTFQVSSSYAAGSHSGNAVVGDFNGDGFLDLAVANSAWGVSVMINAADWGGGHASAVPSKPAPHPFSPQQRPLEALWALLGASQSRSLRPIPVPATDLQPSPVKLGPMTTEIGQPDRHGTILRATFAFAPRQGPGAWFERWADPVVDVLAWSLLK